MDTTLSTSALLYSLVIMIAFVAVAAVFLAKARADFDNMKAEHPRPFTTTTGYSSELIQAFINARWTIQAEIRDCSTISRMETLYWAIEELEMDYKDVVPDQLLITHIDELFAAHTRAALALNTKLKTVISS